MSVNYNYENQIWNKINKFSSKRLELMNEGIQQYGFTLFENKVNTVLREEVETGDNDLEYFVIYNCYINIIVNYGMIIMGIILYGYYKLIESREQRNDNFFKYFVIIY